MTPRDAGNLEQFLREAGASDTVVRGGLEVLLVGWERTVGAIESGYTGDYEDYLGDLDGRQLLAQALEILLGDLGALEHAREQRGDEHGLAPERQ